MKRILLLFCLSSMLARSAPITNSVPVLLSWTYPTNELSTNLTFYVFSTTNASLAITNWPQLTNVVGTNTSVQFNMVPGQQFFSIRASNMWQLGDFSAVVATPFLPRNDSVLSVQKQ